MDQATLLDLFAQYGVIVIVVVMFLEGLNCPGFPAGIILPTAGAIAAGGDIPLWLAVFAATLGGLLGSIVLYGISYAVGEPIVHWLSRKSKKMEELNGRCRELIFRKKAHALFFARLIPVLRTLISIPAGAYRVDFSRFLVLSAGGILCWNIGFIAVGYLVGIGIWG
ncbi:MAG: DedA family protein [Butyricicoccaceae bacterium]